MDKELELVKAGHTADEAKLITDHSAELQRVIAEKPNLHLYVALIVVIIVIVVLIFAYNPEYLGNIKRFNLCDSWLSSNGDEIAIYRDNGGGLYSCVNITNQQKFDLLTNGEYVRASNGESGELVGNHIHWDKTTWRREI